MSTIISQHSAIRRSLLTIACLSLLVLAAEAKAISIASETIDGSFLNLVDDRSYDGPGWNAFTPFGTFVNLSNVLALNTFITHSAGTRLEVTLLSEVAAFANRNQFGLINESGFNMLLHGSAVPGDSTTVDLPGSAQFAFGLKSPEGLFSSVQADNPDGALHMVGFVVTQAGTLHIPQATLGGAGLTFDLLVGDLVLFMEDLLLLGNRSVNPSDFDYNDMVVVIRHTEIPEPMTASLLGLGLLGLGARARRRAAKA